MSGNTRLDRLCRTGLVVDRYHGPLDTRDLVPCTEFFPKLDDPSHCYGCGWHATDHGLTPTPDGWDI